MADPSTRGAGLDHSASQRLLQGGTLDVQGRIADASNATLLATVTLDTASQYCVYKPVAGERPLWDFPEGSLAAREVAAYRVSEATGWAIVPPTVYRDGPFGPGMCQQWIRGDPSVDVAALLNSEGTALRRMALFDAVINNADRKGSHVVPTPEGHVYGIDHGVCFAVEDKLRTLLWQWRGKRLTGEATSVLEALREHLAGGLCDELERLLRSAEIAAIRQRVDGLLRSGRHPLPPTGWPAMPWPPF